MPGPPPTPTALRILRNNPSKRPLPKNEPRPREGEPTCPDDVKANPDARKEWKRLVKILRGMRVLTVADGPLLANYCRVHADLLWNLARVNELNAASKSHTAGVVIATKTGYLAPNQFYLNVHKDIDRLVQIGKEMGLSPAARTRIQVTPGAEAKADDPWAKLG